MLQSMSSSLYVPGKRRGGIPDCVSGRVAADRGIPLSSPRFLPMQAFDKATGY